MYKEKLCPFVCQADFESFCGKQNKHEDGDEDDDNNAPNTE